MTALLIVLAVLAVINLIPVGAKVRYDDGDLAVRVKIGPFGFRIVPKKPVHGKKLARQHEKKRLAEQEKLKKKALKKVKKKRQKEADKQKTEEQLAEEKLKKQKKKLSFDQLLQIARLGAGLVARLPRKLVLKELYLHVIYGGSDAAQAAIGYGRAWAVVGTALPVLEQIFRIRKRDVGVELDYERKSMGIFARLDVHMLVGTAVLLALTAGVKFLGILMMKKKPSKGSAVS